MMQTYTFQEIKIKRTVKCSCTKCGKKLQRVVEAWQTVNPYNMTSDGEPKTPAQIRQELPPELDKSEKWLHKNVVCRNCA